MDLLRLCQCGCGQEVTSKRAKSFIHGHNGRMRLCNWKGGRNVTPDGYIRIRTTITKGYGYQLEHRFVMEQHLGRKLLRNEEVHHINHNKQDNRLENLILIQKAEHTRLHAVEYRLNSMRGRKCCECGSESKTWFMIGNNEFLCQTCQRVKYYYAIGKEKRRLRVSAI